MRRMSTAPALPWPALLLALGCTAGCREPESPWPREPEVPWRFAWDARSRTAAWALSETGDASSPWVVLGNRDTITARAEPDEEHGTWKHGPWSCLGDAGRCPGGRVSLSRWTEPAVLAFPGREEPFSVPEPTPNPPRRIRRAGFRLQELAWSLSEAEPRQPVPAGTFDPRTARVRSVVKVRRDLAPPVLVVSGDAGEGSEACLGLVAVLDHEAEQVLSWDATPLPGPPCPPLALVPPLDLDGDDQPELVVFGGKGRPGEAAVRAVYTFHPERVSATSDAPRDALRPGPALVRRYRRILPAACRAEEP